VDHGRAVSSIKAAVAEPFLPATREDPCRASDAVQLAVRVAPLEHSVDAQLPLAAPAHRNARITRSSPVKAKPDVAASQLIGRDERDLRSKD
jgi:hypothetical protein